MIKDNNANKVTEALDLSSFSSDSNIELVGDEGTVHVNPGARLRWGL